MSKYVIGAAIKYTSRPGWWFLAASPLVFAASPLRVFACKLLNPPSYAGYLVKGLTDKKEASYLACKENGSGFSAESVATCYKRTLH